MKKDQKTVKTREPITKEALFRRNPVPFGDVRKYYYAACIGTVILLTLCFHISVVAIALRTDTCEQLSNVFIVFLLLFCITTIVSHQMRSFLGYGISALSSLIVLLLLQFYHGTGVMIISNLPEYGEVFRDGAKSTDFWILLAKVIAVIHLLLTIVFINSTIKVKEAPALNGMNAQIQKIKDWMNKNNNSLPAGRRASDYWFVSTEILSAMIFWAYDCSMAKYDYWSLGILVVGCMLVAMKKTFVGSLLLAYSALIRCTLYQFRFGFEGPVAAAYIGLYIALLYCLTESNRQKKQSDQENQGLIRRGQECITCVTVIMMVTIVPVHEFLAVFSGDYLIAQKDDLPLLFFLPVLIFLAARAGKWYAFDFAGLGFLRLWYTTSRFNPYAKRGLFYFDSVDQHGSIGPETARRLMILVKEISFAAIIAAGLCFVFSVILFFFRRFYEKRT